MFMIWSRILKMTLIQQQSLHVRHALSGSGLEGDLGERGNRDSNADLTSHREVGLSCLTGLQG